MNKDRLFESLGEQDAATLLESLTGEVYATASRLANAAQKEKLDAELVADEVGTVVGRLT